MRHLLFTLCSPLKSLIFNAKYLLTKPPFSGILINIEREKYIMKKVILLLALLWFGLVSFQNSVKANDYTTAVIGHVIQNHKDIDHSKLLEAELKKMMHSMSIEMVSLLQKHLPYIMDGVMTELKLELDKTHKCLLLKDSKIKDKDCK